MTICTKDSVHYFGEIDDVGVWNRTLTFGEIEELIVGSTSVLSSSNYLWSTGDTTSTITVSPTETTTYTLTQTLNGVSCSDEVTVTVQTTGCGNAQACNFTNGDACDIDCVFAMFNEDCASGETACGPGQVWDIEEQICVTTFPADTNFDGCVDLNDLMDVLASYGVCQMP